MYTISNNHLSVDQQVSDALQWMRLNHPEQFSEIRKEFPENFKWSPYDNHFDTEAMGVDIEWGSWLADAIEATGLVTWVEGEPFACEEE